MPFPERESNWKEQHPDEGVLHEWLEEQLDTEAAARIAAHVSTCETCRARVAEAHGLIAASRRILSALDDVPAGVIPVAAASLSRVDRAPVNASSSATRAPVVNASRTEQRPAHQAKSAPANAFRWRRWGAVAAVLVVGVMGTFVVARRDAPMSVLAVRSDSSAAPAAPSAPTGDSTRAPNMSPVAAATPQPTDKASVAQPVATARDAAVNTSKKPTASAAKVAAPGAPAATPPAQMLSEHTIVAPKSEIKQTTVPLTSNGVGTTVGALAATPPPTPPDAAAGDTLARRLEADRRKRAASEAVVADAAAGARIDAIRPPLPVNAPAKQTAPGLSAPRSAALGASSATTSPSFAAIAFDSLVLSREPCFGRCPAYELFVDAAGRVRYRSHHPDDNGRETSALLSAAEVTRLHDLIERANVETLKSYMPNTTACGLAATDMPTLHLSVVRRGHTYKLDQYLGCSGGTQIIPTLMREIDAVVGTQRWLPAGYKLN